MQIVWKHLPLSIHKNAPAAHAAAEAAHKQGKFWEMHDLIFANQRELNAEKFYEHAAQIGLDVARFKADYVSSEVKKRVDADSREAAGLGVPLFQPSNHRPEEAGSILPAPSLCFRSRACLRPFSST